MSTNTPDGPDEALARLRAADPAADVAPDPRTLEAAVRAQVPEALAGPSEPGGTVADELAERRERRARRRVPLQVAAAVAGVLVVGVGGYALGAGGGTGSAGDTAESSALAPIQLGAAGSAQESAPNLAVAEEAAESQGFSATSRAAADMAYPGSWGGRTVFHQDGLSTQGGSADAWGYDAAGVFSGETARRVADVLGVSGDVSEEWGSYVVGPRDGSGPSVSLQPDGLASVSFHDPSKDPWGCVVVTPMPAEGGSGSEGSEGAASPDVMPVEPGACAEADHGVPPGRDAAVDQLGGVLAALGLDAAGYEIVADEQVAEQEAPRATTVTAYEVVEGQRTGTSWNATYSGAGLASLYGSLAPRVPLGTYDVVSPVEAVERLGDPRFGAGGPVLWARAETLDASAPEIGVAPVEPETPTVPPTVGAGARFAWPVTDVTITDARLGLAVQHQPDGAAVLLPAYELSDADGNVWSVVAVADDQLDFAPAG